MRSQPLFLSLRSALARKVQFAVAKSGERRAHHGRRPIVPQPNLSLFAAFDIALSMSLCMPPFTYLNIKLDCICRYSAKSSCVMNLSWEGWRIKRTADPATPESLPLTAEALRPPLSSEDTQICRFVDNIS